MQTLSILLKTNWQSWLNSIRHAADERRKRVIEIIGFFVLIAALYLMGRAMFGQLGEIELPKVLHAINIFMAFGVFILAKDAMEGSLKRLYEAPDTSLLLSMPLPPATVFGFKLIQLIASNLLNMFIWLIPPWIAFGQIFNLAWHFYLALLPISFCLLVIIMGELTIVMMILVRFFSSRLMIQILKTLGMAIGVAAGLLLSMSLVTIDRSDQIAQFMLNRVKIPASDWYPHLWVAKLLIGWLPESDVQIWRWGGYLIGASVGVPLAGVMLASKIYYRSWEYAKRVEVTTKRKRKRPGGFSLLGRGRLRSLMAKDFRVFIRHRGRLMMIIMLTLIILVATLKSIHEMRIDGTGDWDAHFSLFVLGLQITIYSVMITLGLTWGGFKAEVKTWWMLKSGPITPELLFHSKYLTATLCSVAYTNFWILLGLLLFRIPMQSWASILLSTTLITAMVVAFNTAIGALPWVAELDGGKKPILRIGTILFTILANAVLLIGSGLVLLKIDLFDEILVESLQQFSLATAQQIVIGGTLAIMVGVWGLSYLLGKRSLRKLLN